MSGRPMNFRRAERPIDVVDLRNLCECWAPHHAGSKDTYDQRYLCQRCDSLIRTHNHLSLPLCVGIAAMLNQDRTAIDHNGLTCTESFLHQKQEGLCNVVSFADAPHRQTLANVLIETLPLGRVHVLPQVRTNHTGRDGIDANGSELDCKSTRQ